jgi:hypothetical protein
MPRGRFVNRPYETLIYQGLLACLFDRNSDRYRHTNHGVVTCTDETHHLFGQTDFEASKRLIPLE